MSRRRPGPWWVLVGVALLALLAPVVAAAADQVVYDDSLQNGWQNWSWYTNFPIDFSNPTPTHGGADSISFPPVEWAAVSFYTPSPISSTTYRAFDFWIDGGTGSGQALSVRFSLGGTEVSLHPLADFLPGGPVAGTWSLVDVDLDAIGVTSFDRVDLQDADAGGDPTVYVDDVVVVDRGVPLTLAVDPDADRHAFSPRIFGVNGEPVAGQPPYTVYRWGGNRKTRYDWEHDVDNSANDWFFTNYTGGPDPGTLPDGSSADLFIDAVRALGAEPLVTVPTIGWAPIDRQKRIGFKVSKYGAQQQTECTVTGGAPWCDPDMGNGRHVDGTPILGNDPTDTSRAVGTSFATGWLTHIAGRVGAPSAGGPRFFALDNEPMLWSDTHRDVHPVRLGYDELWTKTESYAAAIKGLGSGYEIFGPVVWGWCAYFWSDADGCGVQGPDYQAHGPLLEWYLQQVADYETANGVSLIDWLDVHYYPQGGTDLSDDESPAVAALRLRTTRSLWDPTYVDESWIAAPIELIPRMKAIIAAHRPGTKLAITEYNFGGKDSDQGLTAAMAEAEALAIFAREGVDLATRWEEPILGSRVEDAFRLYLDYDGAGAQVTGDSVRATTTNVDEVGIYAFRSADAKLFVVLLNKTTSDQAVSVDVIGGLVGSIPLYGFDAGQTLGPAGSATLTAGGFDVTLPARSVRLAVASLPCVLPGAASGLVLAKSGGGATLHLGWTDLGGASEYAVYEDTAPNGAFATLSGTAASGATGLDLAMPGGARFYRVAARNGCGEGTK